MLSVPAAAEHGFPPAADRFGIANDRALLSAPEAACFHRFPGLNIADCGAYDGGLAAAEVPLYKTSRPRKGIVCPRRRAMD
jgi:hypothetical protein